MLGGVEGGPVVWRVGAPPDGPCHWAKTLPPGPLTWPRGPPFTTLEDPGHGLGVAPGEGPGTPLSGRTQEPTCKVLVNALLQLLGRGDHDLPRP